MTLNTSAIVPLEALRIIQEHHEETDGTGYPQGIDIQDISPMAWICRLVDKFDTLTSDKPYRRSLKAPEALQRIYIDETEERYKQLITEFIRFLGGQ